MERIKILLWKKISLVVPQIEDVDLWYRWMNDLEIQSYIGTKFWTIVTYDYEKKYFESMNTDNKNITFSIYVEKAKKCIWNVSLMRLDYINKHGELWIAIFDKKNQDKWYGSEAIKLVQKYFFEILWLNKLSLRYITLNKRAEKVYTNLWFKQTGILRQNKFLYWKYYDDIIMDLLREEYLEFNQLKNDNN